MVYMYNCIIKLCRYLKCSRYELKFVLLDPIHRKRAKKFLNRFDLFFMPTKRQIRLDYISAGGADDMQICRGRKNIDINQFMFVRYYVDLQQPELPCVVDLKGRKPYYYPLETIGLCPRNDWEFDEHESYI